MLSLLLFLVMIKFSWDAPTSGPAPISYRLCINPTTVPVTVPTVCTVAAIAPGTATEKSIDLDVSKVWYAKVVSINQFGESDGSNQVVVGKPMPPANFSGSL